MQEALVVNALGGSRDLLSFRDVLTGLHLLAVPSPLGFHEKETSAIRKG